MPPRRTTPSTSKDSTTDARPRMPRRTTVGKVTPPQIILIGVDNERPSPQVRDSQIRQIIGIAPPHFNIAEIAAVSFTATHARRRTSMTHNS